jgi:3-deoxy-D-manno-octulosonic-acid transferase
MLESGAARQVDSAAQLAAAILELAAKPSLRAEMGARGDAIVTANRGALDRVARLIESLLQASSST